MRFVPVCTAVTLLFLISSCGDSADQDKKVVIDTSIHSPVTTGPVNAGTDTISPVTASPASPVISSPVPGGGALNPAHGQPGHRCDIAVGAPLDSKPSTTAPAATPIQLNPATSPAATVSPVTVTKSSTPTGNTAPGMNPAHGQPGHRCDIAVGAPLNSPAGNTTTPAAQPISMQPSIPAANPVITPAKPAAAPQTATAPGMNPPHGQPGHRCDIAVGAPLNSKPTVEPDKPKTN